MLIKVEAIKTTCSNKDFIKSLILCWRNMYESLPSRASIGVIFAQNALETGGKNEMWNWNIGNVKAADIPGQNIKYMALSGVFEYINGIRVELPLTDPGSFFRAFDTLDEGVSFQLNLLRNTRYKNAWQYVISGSPSEFSHQLKLSGYYTAPEAEYTADLIYQFNIFMNGPSYGEALAEIQASDNATIPFPSDYQPLSLSPLPLKQSFFSNLVNKIKCFFA